MKIFRFVLSVLILAAAVYPQTQSLGMGAFASENGAILLTIDAGLVNRKIDSPYVMFFAFMGAKDQSQSLSVAAKDVVMVYKGKEYSLPTVKDLRENYKGGIRDLDLYERLGKEGVIASWMRMYDFPDDANYFPVLGRGIDMATNIGHMFGHYGFQTPLYFKNPGFAKGDTLTIKVKDARNAQLTGECEIVLD